jgi:opacity protein-like surface antigen
MQTRKALMLSTAAIALTMTAPSAHAASTYVSLFGGGSILNNPGLKGVARTHSTTYQFQSTTSVDTKFKTGYVLGGNWGVDWGTFRTELELAFHQNKSNSTAHVVTQYMLGYVTAGGYPYTMASMDAQVPASLTLHAYSLMANAWYDFHDLDLPGGLTPYIGGGIGGAQVQMSGRLNSIKLYEKNQFVFAWQVGAGASVPLTDSLKLFVDYRYFAADGAKLRIEPGFHGSIVRADFDGHNVLVGLRLSL